MTYRRRMLWIPAPALLVLILIGLGTQLTQAQPKAADTAKTKASEAAAQDEKIFQTKIIPFMESYCFECHNEDRQAGGVGLSSYKSLADARKDRGTWEEVRRVIFAAEMPPKRKPQPSEDEKKVVTEWIHEALTRVDCSLDKDPGRVTIRRLNRAEYNNTIRDLCGVSFLPAETFPSDDVGYGFDNIGDVLSIQPILIEKYLTAAEEILDRGIVLEEKVPPSKQTFRAQPLQARPREAKVRDPKPAIKLATPDAYVYMERLHFPLKGTYAIRIRATGGEVAGETPKLEALVNDRPQGQVELKGTGKPEVLEIKTTVDEGDFQVGFKFLNGIGKPRQGRGNRQNAKEDDEQPVREVAVDYIEIEGPLGDAVRPMPESTRMMVSTFPKDAGGNKLKAAHQSIIDFSKRAFRRPVKPEEVNKLMKLFQLADKQGEPYHEAIKLPLKAILVSPHFLFRIEDDPKDDQPRLLNDFELATRLSYFLWSSMPDMELFQLAQRGELRKPGVLEAQIKRMLKDPKSTALVENFAQQWLQLRNLQTFSPDTQMFKRWDERLRAAMFRESELFFDHIVKEDRPILELLDANYTFANERLAQHYGIPGVRGNDFRKVEFKDNRRGGVITQGSVLAVTSNPTRTSPVNRGKWILENILGTPPPPPAPDVPELPDAKQLTGTLRQQMEQHRENPNCATCHAKLDPLGFGLENFDAIGTWRTEDNKQKIDSSGVLPDGASFDGPAELRKVLLGKSDQFRKCLAEKLLTFALGRGLEYYDKCALDEIVEKVKSSGDKFSALVLAVVETDAFQKRRALRSE